MPRRRLIRGASVSAAIPPPMGMNMTESVQKSEAAEPKRRTKKPAGTASASLPPKGRKADALVALLSRSRGATLDDMMAATGWQAHSVRGFISGTLKKKLGRTVTSEKTPKGRVYRLTPGVAA